MEQSLKIKPTVYVGLGTTGMEILNHLRRLNHQEYGEAGLPIFRYVSIETDAGKTGIDPKLMTIALSLVMKTVCLRILGVGTRHVRTKSMRLSTQRFPVPNLFVPG